MVSIALQLATVKQFNPMMAQFVSEANNLTHHCNILWIAGHIEAKDVEDWLVATEGDYDARVNGQTGVHARRPPKNAAEG